MKLDLTREDVTSFTMMTRDQLASNHNAPQEKIFMAKNEPHNYSIAYR